MKRFFLWIAALGAGLCLSGGLPLRSGSPPKSISNGIVEIRFPGGPGVYELVDAVRGEVLAEGASVAFFTAPWREMDDVREGESEADGPSREYRAEAGRLRLARERFSGVFGNGDALRLTSEFPGEARIEVLFRIYPGRDFVDIGWRFTNLGEKPIRLRRVNVLDARRVFPGRDLSDLKMLNGDGGHTMNRVQESGDVRAENNLLFFLADEDRPRCLVAGGLTYQDYRKFVQSRSRGTRGVRLYAYDPVGRRVGPGRSWDSPDRFYAAGGIDNPFEALESYARTLQTAQDIHVNPYTFPSVCMWFLAVRHFGGDSGSVNDTPGAVREMDHIRASGFLRYSPVAVRLVPDNYELNNQQGWWDDEHWRRHGRAERCIVEGGHVKAPYESMEKWGRAIRERGGIPFLYFQPGVRSEDYAEAFPGHMLFNDSHRYILDDRGERQRERHAIRGKIYGAMVQESYDYTDEDFIRHLKSVYAGLRRGGIRGIFFDYPRRCFPERGGMEDRDATAAAAYRNVFRIARAGLGPVCWLQERLGIGSDATLGLVDSIRTAGDTNVMRPEEIRKTALRWYKNRRLVSFDMDGKALLRYGPEQQFEVTRMRRRALLTLSYAVTGRLLLTESFRRFSTEALHDLSRVFPFHDTPLSARPLDAFVREFPSVFDFAISGDWHQLILDNRGEAPRRFEIAMAGDTAFGALGLDPGRDYYVYDFWNDAFVGRVSGSGRIGQAVAAGEARMLAVHSVEPFPQWISTDRHLMQGYVDLVEKPGWDAPGRRLSGVSRMIGNEACRITIALNGFAPLRAESGRGRASVTRRAGNPGLADLVIEAVEGGPVAWSVVFGKTPPDEKDQENEKS